MGLFSRFCCKCLRLCRRKKNPPPSRKIRRNKISTSDQQKCSKTEKNQAVVLLFPIPTWLLLAGKCHPTPTVSALPVCCFFRQNSMTVWHYKISKFILDFLTFLTADIVLTLTQVSSSETSDCTACNGWHRVENDLFWSVVQLTFTSVLLLGWESWDCMNTNE